MSGAHSPIAFWHFILVLNVDGLAVWQENGLGLEDALRLVGCQVVAHALLWLVVQRQSPLHQLQHFVRLLLNDGDQALLGLDCLLAV